jgi:hypothetical protein
MMDKKTMTIVAVVAVIAAIYFYKKSMDSATDEA